MIKYNLTHKLSWGAILAWLVAGLVTFFAMMALWAILTAYAHLGLTWTSWMAIIWTAISMAVAAYLAGYIAMESTKSNLTTDWNTIRTTTDDANLTGLLTGATMILASTWMAVTGLSNLVTGVANVAWSVAGAAGSTVANATNAVIQSSDLDTLFASINNADQKAIEEAVSANIKDANWNGLSSDQVVKTSQAIKEMIDKTRDDVQQLNVFDVNSVKGYAEARFNAIKTRLTGQNFVDLLKSYGLTDAQSRDVVAKSQVYVDKLQTQYNTAAAKVNEGLVAAENTARTAAVNAGFAWLLPAILTILAAIMGANSAIDTTRRYDSTRKTTNNYNTTTKKTTYVDENNDGDVDLAYTYKTQNTKKHS